MEKIIQRRSQKWLSMRLAHRSPFSSPRNLTEETKSIFSWIQKYFHMPTNSFLLFFPLPSLGQSKGILFCFAVLLAVGRNERKWEVSYGKQFWYFYLNLIQGLKILSQSLLHAQQLPVTLANTVDFRLCSRPIRCNISVYQIQNLHICPD